AMWKRTSPAHHLVRLLRVNPKPERKSNRLIEFRRRKLFKRGDGISQTVSLCAVRLLRGCAITFASIPLHISVQFKRLVTCSVPKAPAKMFRPLQLRWSGARNLATIFMLSKPFRKIQNGRALNRVALQPPATSSIQQCFASWADRAG